MTGSPKEETPPGVSAAMSEGKPARDNLHLKREALLAQLFPAQVHRPKLGRYDVLEFVGEGGMGTVFAAYDARLDRRVAVKLLRQAGAAKGQRRARLLREAKALAKLSHPNIVTIHEVWEENGEVHLAMEFIEGQNLAQWHHNAMPWREVLEAYRQAGEGLAAAHAAGLVYRDFKPHNAIRRKDGVVKLLDFGLARMGEGDGEDSVPTEEGAASLSDDEGQDDHLTRPGSVMGTPAYMSPEQRSGQQADARSDQFGYCVALWEGLYGELPFARSVQLDVAQMGERVEPARLSQVPSWVRSVVERGLCLDPSGRYSNMAELLRALGRDPAARRRRWLSAGLVVAVALGGGFAVAEMRSEPQCVAPEDPWSETRREAVKRGVFEADVGGANQTWALLEPRLDRHADEIVASREAACVSHARGMVPDAHYERQVACLDRGHVGFETVVDLLARGDTAAVANANHAVTSLPSPDQCADVEALMAEEQLPSEPAVAAEVVDLRQELARASAEESAGLFVGAEERAFEVLTRARALEYPPLTAEALVRWGSAGLQLERDDVLDRFDEALWLSIASEQRASAAEAAAKRIFVRVELQDRLADVSEAIALARSLVERGGAADWRVRWVLDNNIAIAHDRGGRATEALESHRSALSRIPHDDDRGAWERAVSRLNMAPVQVVLGQAQAAEESGREAVRELEGLFGRGHAQVRVAESSLATVQGDVGRYEEAVRTLNAMVASYDKKGDVPMWLLVAAAKVAQSREDVEALRGWIARANEALPPFEETPTTWHSAVVMLEARAEALSGNPAAPKILEDWESRVEGRQRTRIVLERAQLELSFGDPRRAEALVRPLLDDASLPELNARAARVLMALAVAKQERWDEAHPLLLALVDSAQKYDLRQRVATLVALADVERGLGHVDLALRRAQEAQAVVESFDRDSPEVRAVEAVLARAQAAKEPAVE